jgi:Glucodextranase, domain B
MKVYRTKIPTRQSTKQPSFLKSVVNINSQARGIVSRSFENNSLKASDRVRRLGDKGKSLPKVVKPSRRLFAYGVVMMVIIVVGAIWGLTLLSSISIFWDSIRGNGTASAASTSQIVGAPTLESLPPSISKPRITISGEGEAGAVVTIYKQQQKVADQLVGNDGKFSFTSIVLVVGENIFTAKQAIDTSESLESNAVSVILDLTPPKLTVDKPADGASVSTSGVYVSGHADVNSYVMINDHEAVVGQDGSFNGVAILSSGDNKITVTSTDDAGNKTAVIRTVTKQ